MESYALLIYLQMRMLRDFLQLMYHLTDSFHSFLSSEGIFLCLTASWHSERGNRKFLDSETRPRRGHYSVVRHSPESVSENAGMYCAELQEATGRRPAGTGILLVGEVFLDSGTGLRGDLVAGV